ncbi:MAG: ABC transporter ATP-binding protein [Fimbriimonadaceae bacterium]|nr:MAG: ABC transporter ATP-binding protein [Fimbriimonadaceae bacterium]
MIDLKSVSLIYQDHGKEVFACKDIDLGVQPGEFLGILGPSGSGKSSLLYVMSGLKVPTKGSVEWLSRELGKMGDQERAEIRLREFGFVFQYPFLIGYLTALENVLLAFPAEDRRADAEKFLIELGLQDQMHRYPYQMSGGQKQRVCVARALLGSPKVVFADEPTASLDHKSGRAVMDLLIQNRGDGALVVVTHDPVMLEGADRIIRMEDGEIAPKNA